MEEGFVDPYGLVYRIGFVFFDYAQGLAVIQIYLLVGTYRRKEEL